MKVSKLFGLFILAVGVTNVGNFILILSSNIFIPVVHAEHKSTPKVKDCFKNSRNVPTRRDPVDQAETNILQGCAALLFRTFDLKVLEKFMSALV